MDLLARTLALLAMTVATVETDVKLLDMAPDSFDDQYRGCRSAMTAALPALNRSEFFQSYGFVEGWALAVAEWQSRGSCVSPLSPAQAIALMVYTNSDLYPELSEAMRVAGRSSREYRDKFHYKVLHFLLTDALATLRDIQGQQCRCVSSSVDWIQFEAQPGQRVRFGQFELTSLCTETAQDIGSHTEFQVHTCHGVDIKGFSFHSWQYWVLIPPFETFNVTKVTRKGDKVQIWLNSTGTHSNYNCEWLRGGSVPTDPAHLGGLLLATVALAVATGTL